MAVGRLGGGHGSLLFVPIVSYGMTDRIGLPFLKPPSSFPVMDPPAPSPQDCAQQGTVLFICVKNGASKVLSAGKPTQNHIVL